MNAFLHGELNEAVFIDQPQGYEKQGEEHKVYRLKKALYGLSRLLEPGTAELRHTLPKRGSKNASSGDKGKLLIVSLYVDDLIFTGNDEDMFKSFKESMKKEFDMSDLGRMKYFLGVEVVQNSDGIFICQRKYAKEVLERFGMERSNPVNNPIVPGCKLSKSGGGAVNVDATEYKQLVGSLLYLTATRPDLMYAVGLISRYMEKPTEMHLQAAKRILRYLKGTMELGIGYKKGDSDYAGDVDDRKSTSGYVFMLGTGAISWSSKKQPVVSLYTTEAEFIAAASCMSRGLRWIVELEHCSTEEQVSDIMTKPLKLE
ncbi:ADP glucose pyrophosphorylase large subunit 1, partial [Prunus dulcis]